MSNLDEAVLRGAKFIIRLDPASDKVHVSVEAEGYGMVLDSVARRDIETYPSSRIGESLHTLASRLIDRMDGGDS